MNKQKHWMIARKTFHLLIAVAFMLALTVLIAIFGQRTTLVISGFLLLVVMILDTVRIEKGVFGFIRRFIKPREKRSFSDLTDAMAIGVVVLAIFDAPLALAAIAISIFGDPAAALIGTFWGKHRIFRGNTTTWEGSAGFFVVAWAISLIFVAWPVGLAMAAAGAVIEGLTKHADDNFIVPLAAAWAGWVVSIFV